MQVSAKKNMGLSLCRTVATVMIVICHLGTAYGYSAIGQFFQSGVQVFLIISGLLYGDKTIGLLKPWLISRWKRISIPCYVHVFVIVIVCLLRKVSFSPLGIIEVLLNIEGYHHIVTFINNNWVISGTAHFWFVTVIFLCYGIVALFKANRVDERIQKNKRLILGLLFVSSIITGFFGVRIDYFVIFLFGYALASSKEKKISGKQITVSTVFFIVSVGLRLVAKQYFDLHGDNNLYLNIIIPLSYNIIAFSIYTYVMKTNEFITNSKSGYSDLAIKGIIEVDNLSYYIFITHYMLIDGPISLTYYTTFFSINILLIFAGTLFASMILKYVSESIFSYFLRFRGLNQ